MSGTLRYRNPELCDELASRYVTGRMTAPVRRRLENLMQTEPELEQAVARWADRMAPLHDTLPDHQPPTALWSHIAASIQEKPVAKPPQDAVILTFRRRVAAWRITALAGLAASLLLAIALTILNRPQTGVVTASYLAPLSNSNGTVALVVSGYKAQADQKSQLVVQWSHANTPKENTPLYLWAEDRISHAMVYLGKFSNQDRHWALSKAQWKAVTQSSRLLVSKTPDQISAGQASFIGPCLQLKGWQQKS